ncbi:copper resistance CopC family protein [Lentzea sp. NPDC042327]|uniref:copper resistance CopC family protein n=1 Tax=Lentzea sp. NPDC042327 TaxID=3154801 RepID=UPI0033ED677D
MIRYLIAFVLVLLAATGTAGPASAHAELKSSTPAAGATLDAAPKQVELVFSDTVSLPEGDAVVITGPDGATWPVTRAAAVGSTITATVDPAAAKSGAHTLTWAAQADDGDVVRGTVAFTLNVVAVTTSAPVTTTTSAAAASTAPPAASAEQGSDGLPAWVWVVLGLVVVVGALLLVRRRKQA